ncbi:MAG: hypothetical protein CL504_06900, partial [Actinobacteria bacterium]|nr:hypothetical protein [Actinomycetota bacterium]
MVLGKDANEVPSGELRPLRRSIQAPGRKSTSRSLGTILTVSRKIAQDLARPLSRRIGSVGELPVQINPTLLPHVARQSGSLNRWGDRDLIAIKERWSPKEKTPFNEPRGLPRASNAGGRSQVGSGIGPSGIARKLLLRQYKPQKNEAHTVSFSGYSPIASAGAPIRQRQPSGGKFNQTINRSKAKKADPLPGPLGQIDNSITQKSDRPLKNAPALPVANDVNTLRSRGSATPLISNLLNSHVRRRQTPLHRQHNPVSQTAPIRYFDHLNRGKRAATMHRAADASSHELSVPLSGRAQLITRSTFSGQARSNLTEFQRQSKIDSMNGAAGGSVAAGRSVAGGLSR